MLEKHLTWQDIDRLTNNVYKQINKKYDWVISINAGGLIPGVMLSKKLKAKHGVISVNNYSGKKKNEKISKDLYISQIGFIKPHHKILLVDNIIRTGESIQAALQSLKKVDPDAKMVDSATLNLNKKSEFKPTYFAEETDREIWKIYPWEI